MKELALLVSAGIGGLWLGVAGVGLASGYAWWLAQDQGGAALTMIERNGVFGLFSLVILGSGTFVCRVGMRMVDSVNGNTQAVAAMTKAVEQMIQQNQMALSQLSTERKDAVSLLSGRIDSIKVDLLREFDGRADGKK